MAALSGLKVLDCTHVIAGAYCSMVLADLGADVIKIEPPAGETTRGHPGAAFRAFDFVNRNKRAIALDLTTERGAGVLRKRTRAKNSSTSRHASSPPSNPFHRRLINPVSS